MNAECSVIDSVQPKSTTGRKNRLIGSDGTESWPAFLGRRSHLLILMTAGHENEASSEIQISRDAADREYIRKLFTNGHGSGRRSWTELNGAEEEGGSSSIRI